MAERRIRTKEERIAEIDKKIEFHQQKIDALEAKKQSLLTPKMTATQIIAAAKDKGLTTEQIIKKLGI